MFDLSKNLVSSLSLWLVLAFGFGLLVSAAIGMVMLFTDHDPSDVRRALAVRAHERKRAMLAAAGEELPPDPDPALVLMPAIVKEPGAQPRIYSHDRYRTCEKCGSTLSKYWPEDSCLDCIATGRVKRDAITGAITNR